MTRIARLIILASTLVFTCQADAMELPRTCTQAEIVAALHLPDGPTTGSGGTYLIEDGVIYKLIRGKRFRPRCMVKEMEEILPRVSVSGMFDVDSIEPRYTYLKLLDRLGDALMTETLKYYSFRIVAHTDGTGSSSYNFRLSRERALWIKQYLEQKSGADPERLIAEGLGAGQPTDSNETTTGRAKNRRVEFQVTGADGRIFLKPCEGESRSE
jgi:outer membrane protein OmpA-like peptidoglycan-associated protein